MQYIYGFCVENNEEMWFCKLWDDESKLSEVIKWIKREIKDIIGVIIMVRCWECVFGKQQKKENVIGVLSRVPLRPHWSCCFGNVTSLLISQDYIVRLRRRNCEDLRLILNFYDYFGFKSMCQKSNRNKKIKRV